MYNSSSDHNGGGGGAGVPMSPRISFSNDFVESPHYQQQRLQPPTTGYSRPTAEPSTDFEFSVSDHYSLQLMTADELFSQGRMLPLMNNRIRHPTATTTTTTLRDELLVEEEEVQDSVNNNNNNNNVGKRRPPLAGGWRSFLGIKKSHIGSRKPPVSPVAAAESEPQIRFDESVTKGQFFHGVDPNPNTNLFSSSSTQQGMLTDDSTEDMKF